MQQYKEKPIGCAHMAIKGSGSGSKPVSNRQQAYIEEGQPGHTHISTCFRITTKLCQGKKTFGYYVCIQFQSNDGPVTTEGRRNKKQPFLTHARRQLPQHEEYRNPTSDTRTTQRQQVEPISYCG